MLFVRVRLANSGCLQMVVALQYHGLVALLLPPQVIRRLRSCGPFIFYWNSNILGQNLGWGNCAQWFTLFGRTVPPTSFIQKSFRTIFVHNWQIKKVSLWKFVIFLKVLLSEYLCVLYDYFVNYRLVLIDSSDMDIWIWKLQGV